MDLDQFPSFFYNGAGTQSQLFQFHNDSFLSLAYSFAAHYSTGGERAQVRACSHFVKRDLKKISEVVQMKFKKTGYTTITAEEKRCQTISSPLAFFIDFTSLSRRWGIFPAAFPFTCCGPKRKQKAPPF